MGMSELERRIAGLPASPPRSVPLLVRLRLLFGGFHNQFGWLFFGFGMVFVWVFGGANLLVDRVYFAGRLESVQGSVTEVVDAKYSINESKVYRYHYKFAVGGRAYTGVTTAFKGALKSGDTVTIEYPHANPARSRIRNLSTGLGGAFILIPMIFPLIGLVFIVVGVRKGLKGCRLLRDGKVAMGEMISCEPTNTQINNQTVYKFIFRYTADDGNSYKTTAKTHRTDKLSGEKDPSLAGEDPKDEPIGPREPLLYNPGDPRDAVVLDSLPGEPRIDENGQIRVKALWATLACMVIPLVSVVGHTWYGVRVLQ